MGTSPFTRTAAGAVAGLLAVMAMAAAGCGGGSSSTTGTTAAGTAKTSTTAGPIIPPSTVIASSNYVNLLAKRFEARGLKSSQAQAAARCVQAGLTKAGFKTQDDAGGSNEQKTLQVILPCIQKAKNQ